MTWKLIPLTLCAAAMFAQGPMRGTPPATAPDSLKEAIGLTDAQFQQLIQLRQTQAETNRTTHQQILAKQKELHDLLAGGSAQPAAVGQLVLDREALRKQIESSDTTFQAQALQVLTADQKTKLEALTAAAKLIPAVHAAAGLGLLAPPEGGRGPGFGPGPGMGGMGPGGPMGPPAAGFGFRWQAR